jgi:hypothetical protein
MSPDDLPPSSSSRHDADYWAQLATNTLTVRSVPRGAVNLNVEGHRVFGPLQGFGPLWKKTFRVRLAGRPELTPTQVVGIWKAEFAHFWPRGQRFFASPRGIVPGEVALLNLRAGLPLETGMLVLYADDESFTLMTPQGHMYASWITFSADTDDDACVAAQVQMLLRTGDPIFDLIMRCGGFSFENGIWQHTLRSLASRLGADGDVDTEEVCLDRHVQWAYISNIWHNSGMWTAFYYIAAPLRRAIRALRRRSRERATLNHAATISAGAGEEAGDA